MVRGHDATSRRMRDHQTPTQAQPAMPDSQRVILLAGKLGDAAVSIELEVHNGGGRSFIYTIRGHEVTRECFICAMKLSSALSDDKRANGLLDRLPDPR